MNKLTIISILLYVLLLTAANADEFEYYQTERLIIDGAVGYGIQLNEKKDSPVDYDRGGLYLHFRLTYLFNPKTGLSVLGGYQHLYSYNEDGHNSKLFCYPVELAYNLTFQRLKCLTGIGLYFVNSSIDAFDLVSESSYLDIGYFISFAYGLNIQNIKFSPELKLNYIIDTEVWTLIPLLSISYSI